MPSRPSAAEFPASGLARTHETLCVRIQVLPADRLPSMPEDSRHRGRARQTAVDTARTRGGCRALAIAADVPEPIVLQEGDSTRISVDEECGT